MVDETLRTARPSGGSDRRQRRGAHGRVGGRSAMVSCDKRSSGRKCAWLRAATAAMRGPYCTGAVTPAGNAARVVAPGQMTANATVSAVLRGLGGGAAPAGRRPDLREDGCSSSPSAADSGAPQPAQVRRMMILDMVRPVGPAQGRARVARAARRSELPDLPRWLLVRGSARCGFCSPHSKEACCCSGCSGQAGAPALPDVAAGSRSRLANQRAVRLAPRAARLAPRVARPFVRVAPAKPQSVSFRHDHAAPLGRVGRP